MRMGCFKLTIYFCLALGCFRTLAGKPMNVDFIDEEKIPYGFSINGNRLAGGVGLAYDFFSDNGTYFLLLAGSEQGPASFFTLTWEIDASGFYHLNLPMTSTVLTDVNGVPFDWKEVQPTSLTFFKGYFFWSTDGEGPGKPHSIRLMGMNGVELKTLPNPLHHRPLYGRKGKQLVGIVNGYGYSGISVIGRNLYAINRGPLIQDGKITHSDSSFVRVAKFPIGPMLDEDSPRMAAEYLWPVGPIPERFTHLEVVDIEMIDKNRGLVLETLKGAETDYFRSFLYMMTIREIDSTGEGSNQTFQASSVLRIPSLTKRQVARSIDPVNGPIFPLRKTLLAEISERTLRLMKGKLDYLQGMVLGQKLEDGRRIVLMGSDDEFKAKPRCSQAIAFAIEDTRERKRKRPV